MDYKVVVTRDADKTKGGDYCALFCFVYHPLL